MNQIPFTALLIGLVVQTLVTMAAYSIPAAAPAIALDLAISGEWVGVFISIVYGVGIVSAVLSPTFIYRFGAVRVSQFTLLSGAAMLLCVSLGGTIAALALGAVLLGLGYGATAPSSSQLLMKRTPDKLRNLVFSIRQIGVPLGGVLGGLLVPPLVIAFSWHTAIGLQVIPVLLTLVVLQRLRNHYDADRNALRSLGIAGLIAPLSLLKTVPEIRVLAAVCFFFAGTQLCFVAYTSVHLTSQTHLNLVQAGQMLAAYQFSGVISRPIWGWLADRFIPAHYMLAAMGLTMAITAVLAGSFSSSSSFVEILGVIVIAGATASGYTGLAFAEFARIGGRAHVAEATGLGASSQFLGVMVLPTLFGVIVINSGYDLAYTLIAVLASLSGIGLLIFRQRQH